MWIIKGAVESKDAILS